MTNSRHFALRALKSPLRSLSVCALAMSLNACWLGEQLYLSQFYNDCKMVVSQNEAALAELSVVFSDLPYANVSSYGFPEGSVPERVDLRLSFLNEDEITQLYDAGKRDFLFQDTIDCDRSQGDLNYLACVYRSPPTNIRVEFGDAQSLEIEEQDDVVARTFSPHEVFSEEDREWLNSNFSDRLSSSIEQLKIYNPDKFRISVVPVEIVPYRRRVSREVINEVRFSARITRTVELLDGSGRTFEFQDIVSDGKSACGNKVGRLSAFPKHAYLGE